MRKVFLIAIGCALLNGAGAAQAQSAAAKAGYLGIGFKDQRFVSAAQSNAQVLVRDVLKDSPAAKAGIKAGDEILRINGMSAANGKFAAVARTLTEGDTVKLRIKRNNQELDYTIVAALRPNTHMGTFGERTILINGDSIRHLMRNYLDSARVHLDSLKLPRVWLHSGDSTFDIRIERFRGRVPPDSIFFRGHDTAFVRGMHRRAEGELGPGVIFRSFEIGSRAIAGAEFTDLDPAMKTYFGTDRGLLTLRVAPGTPAARAGLLPGDVLIKAGDTDVSRIAQLRDVVSRNANRETLKIEVVRKGQNKTLQIATPGGPRKD